MNGNDFDANHPFNRNQKNNQLSNIMRHRMSDDSSQSD